MPWGHREGSRCLLREPLPCSRSWSIFQFPLSITRSLSSLEVLPMLVISYLIRSRRTSTSTTGPSRTTSAVSSSPRPVLTLASLVLLLLPNRALLNPFLLLNVVYCSNKTKKKHIIHQHQSHPVLKYQTWLLPQGDRDCQRLCKYGKCLFLYASSDE